MHYVLRFVDRADARMVTAAMLLALQAPAETLSNELQFFEQDGNTDRITAADVATDQLLDGLRAWVPNFGVTDEALIGREALEQVQVAATGAQEQMTVDLTQLEQRTTQLTESLTQAEDAQRNTIQGLQTALDQLSESVSPRLDEINGTIEAQKARLDQAISEYQAQFSAAQEERLREFNERRCGCRKLVRAG